MEKDLLELGFKKEYNWFILIIDEEKEIQVYNGMVRLIPKKCCMNFDHERLARLTQNPSYTRCLITGLNKKR